MGELISIVMPLYNCEKFLKQSIDSIINQTYQNWELILVDDCSTDNSGKIGQAYVERDSRIKYHRLEKNSGAAVARNTGIKMATGNILSFLDSDDTWVPEKLAKEYAFMKEKDAAIVFAGYDLMNENGVPLNKIVHVPEKIDYKEHLYRHIIWTSTIMIDLTKIGKFEMPNLRAGQDVATWLMLLKKCDYAYGIDEVLASYRQVPNSISNNLWRRLVRTWKIYRESEKFSVPVSAYYYVLHMLVTLQKRKRK